ncbi:hypothetical protein V498_01366 [Pseudogymnoascus sp. VKM F-4517 (FW-2822)]|nr:hypothetical protein V498_01366 [Pseudogymnoascus sp. VKM F-4517 (FW-2822)]
MHFTPLIAAAIIAATTAATPIAPLSGDLTAQLTIADSQTDRIDLLPENSDFHFDFSVNTNTPVATRKSFPALVGSGASMAIGTFGPCGFSLPHMHPRATELFAITEGKVHTEMIVENGVQVGNGTNGRRVIETDVSANQMTVFYQGAVHSQFNMGCSNATFVAGFGGEDPGAAVVDEEVVVLAAGTFLAPFGTTAEGHDVDAFKGKISAGITEGVEKCLKACGIQKRAVV